MVRLTLCLALLPRGMESQSLSPFYTLSFLGSISLGNDRRELGATTGGLTLPDGSMGQGVLSLPPFGSSGSAPRQRLQIASSQTSIYKLLLVCIPKNKNFYYSFDFRKPSTPCRAMETLEFIIHPDGRVEEQVTGIIGRSCAEVTAAIEAQLGRVVSQQTTADYYAQGSLNRATSASQYAQNHG